MQLSQTCSKPPQPPQPSQPPLACLHPIASFPGRPSLCATDKGKADFQHDARTTARTTTTIKTTIGTGVERKDSRVRRAKSTTLFTNLSRRRTSAAAQSSSRCAVSLQGYCKMTWIGNLRRTRFLRLIQAHLYCYDARVRVLLWSVPVTGARVRMLPQHTIVLSKLTTGSVIEFSVHDDISCRYWGSALLQASMISHPVQAHRRAYTEESYDSAQHAHMGKRHDRGYQTDRSKSSEGVRNEKILQDERCSDSPEVQRRHLRWASRAKKKFVNSVLGSSKDSFWK